MKQLQITNILKQLCNGFIPVKRDGNCFQTAFGFSFIKLLLINYEDYIMNLIHLLIKYNLLIQEVEQTFKIFKLIIYNQKKNLK
ncbi:unnamed protein product [Paramecium sonneborni]|uniref:Uncharacterized protein n=1 Tax=Paramecium sonneborni TaxID=65129 RepID=A0A8S1R086_9CILI|nr:unnamed protein product [Paramecium sonneborni]